MKKCLREMHREFSTEAAKFGCAVHLPPDSKNHWKWQVEAANGDTRTMVTSQTVSDRRAKQKRIQVLRKICNELTGEN